jgi:hypothetical protein
MKEVMLDTIAGDKKKDDLELRSQPRYEMELSVALQILIPEETFTPKIQPGRAVNLSVRGMKVCLDGISHDFCFKLLQEKRFVRVSLTNPFNGLLIKLMGRIIWVDYHNAARPKFKSESYHSYMGILFEDDKSEGYVNFTRMIRKIEGLWKSKSTEVKNETE